tara:strand:- start:191 stop:718 length:528 start_codon:yes stop_codon:yes gene_type:complete
MKTINIKGKEYVEVNERLKHFRANYKDHSLVSEVLDKTETSVLIKATILDKEGRALATGLAEEEKGSTFINKTSYVENCETSAWGRALANFGIGLDTSVASADEVKVAIANQNKKTAPQKTTIELEIGGNNWDKVLNYVAVNKEKGLPTIVKELQRKYNVTAKHKTELNKIIKTK